MEDFVNYLNTELPDKEGNHKLFKFKKDTLDEMTQRASEIASRGINNSKVINDLIISEHPDLKQEYKDYYEHEYSAAKTKRIALMNIFGSAAYLLLIVTVYLLASFITQRWDMTWAIVVDGVLVWVVYLLFLGIRKFTSLRRIFHIFARMLLAGAIIISTVAVYLGVLAVTDNTTPNRWLIVIFGLIAMFVSDGVYALVARHRLAIINCLVYIPVIAVFIFIIVGALAIMPWSIAWILIPLSLIVDLALILISIGKNKLEKIEVADTWNEN